MSNKAHFGIDLLVMALVAGAAGDFLMRARAGLNILAWVALVTALGWYAFRRYSVPIQGEGRWLLVPTLFLAAAFAWRNSPMLLALDMLILAGTLALVVLTTRTGRLYVGGVVDYVLAALAGGVNVAIGPVLLLTADVSWKELPRTRWSRTAVAVTRGLLIAIPLLILFGALFMAADAVYERLVTGLLNVRLDLAVSHILGVACFAWLAGGLLRAALAAVRPELGDLDRSVDAISLGTVEAATVLGSLDLLFASFVAVQFRYLFGGASLVVAATGLSYADYARRGFFELAAVAGLVLPLLLLGHWLLRKENERGQRVFRILAGVMLTLVAVVMTSAFYRMGLYRQEFGLTELRFYVTAFMIWLAGVLAWFATTVLREHREWFMVGVLVSGYVALFLLHAVNPDAYIARTNVAHYGHTGRFDAGYATYLSADAVPALVEGLAVIPEDRQSQVARELLQRWSRPDRPDWRAWNWGRSMAWQAVEKNRNLLEQAASIAH